MYILNYFFEENKIWMIIIYEMINSAIKKDSISNINITGYYCFHLIIIISLYFIIIIIREEGGEKKTTITTYIIINNY